VLLGLLIVSVAIAAVLLVPSLIVHSEGLTATEYAQQLGALRTTLVQLFAAIFVFGGLFFTLQTVRLNRLSLLATTDSQLAERYAKSLELVTIANTFDTRLGGILALERLARTSAADRQTVVRFLSALLPRGRPEEKDRQRSPAELSAIINALGELRHIESDEELSLVRLSLADLEPVSLRTVTTDMTGCELQRLTLHDSRLTGSSLADGYLEDVDIRFSQCERLMARGATFRRCDMSWCSLAESVFIGADMSGVSLVGSNLNQTLFIGANLRGANLRATDLSKVVLDDADLEDAVADGNTLWPPDVDPQARGVKLAG
jgi:uncharacterized protein YjbI with pentapeptide repeats